jgi:hypothetical protein
MCKKLQWQYQNSMGNTILKFFIEIDIAIDIEY